MITFKQQFDKLTEAYINDRVNPYNSCACFIGNLLNGKGHEIDEARSEWALFCGGDLEGCIKDERRFIKLLKDEAEGFYTPIEILEMEVLFVNTYTASSTRHEEDDLFIAFSKTLDLLKQIHESKGEIVEPFEFAKRQLV